MCYGNPDKLLALVLEAEAASSDANQPAADAAKPSASFGRGVFITSIDEPA